MKHKKLYMIGNAHLDPVWLWQWQEGFQETKATFRSALDRMKEYDDFIFTSSSAANYEWVENSDRKMFEEIKERVREGRWQIVGGWWIQPDCNIPGGESFVRQGLYGQRYFKEKLGVTAKVGYNVDSFGHHGMLPQILLKSGMPYYIFMRPMPNEKGLPGRLFHWESDDGSRVMTYRIPFEYCTWGKDLEKHVRRCMEELKDPFGNLMVFYGVGNHGGGPTKENINSIKRMNALPEFPAMEMAAPNEFFADMEALNLPIPVVHDDLQHHASGCYAVHSGIKHWNRLAENTLLAAEKWSSLAEIVTGQPYPTDYHRAWKNVLFNQFHDILAGTSLESAYEDARNMHGEAMTIAERGLNYAIQSFSWNIGIEQEDGMKPIVVFNPHSWESRVNVELEVGGIKDTTVLVDETGKQVPFQLVQSQATAGGRFRLSFIADLPSMGYRVYKVKTTSSEPKLAAQPIKANDFALENDRLRLEFDPKTGFISSLLDKKVQYEVFRGPAARPVVIEDKSDTWSHNVFHFNNQIGDFMATSVQRVEHGPVKSVIRVSSEFGSSTIVQDFTLFKELDYIDVKVTVDWREQFKMLKLVFPVNLIFTKQTYEIPYGFKEREHNGEEEPGQSWVDYGGILRDGGEHGGTSYGVSLMNDAKYSYSIMNKELAITVLRSPIYAHHDPVVPEPQGHYSFIDQGIQTFTYRILPHQGSWEQAGTVKHAMELNQRPTTIIESYHEGELPQKDSFLTVDQDNIIVSVVKKAEEGNDLIIRAYETTRETTEAIIRLPRMDREISARFGPCEIKTFRVPADPSLPITETDLIEW
ncbi:Mannosylglycerate hydrolase [Paenibacillus allorhizoplanae]|uniref:Mannosylglycerate hydrolase n=1 Tax=Paenibacillus allorhizoplanae TaxID=2905648 RepID=A0ABM9BSK9_9BACL|nr:alpha-mannosidase [Paenibacillus allorhizoplanae]CAH1192525.1 Mannosylglycerate hydrolase [Paenibacillus allorhizoplanae]